MASQGEGNNGRLQGQNKLVSLAALSVLIVFISIAISLLVIGGRYKKLRASADILPAEIKKAREAGLAITSDDLNASASKNAEEYLNIVRQFTKLRTPAKLSPQTFVNFDVEVTPERRAELQSTVKLFEPVLTSFEKWMASNQQPIRVDWDIQGDISETWSVLFEYTTQAISFHAFLSFEKGDLKEGERNILLLDQISQRLSSWPSMYAFIASTRCIKQIDAVASGIASHFPNDSIRLSKLTEILRKVGNQVKPDQAVRLEIFQTVSNLRNLGSAAARGRYYDRPTNNENVAQAMNREETPDTWQKQAALARYLALMTPLWQEMKVDPASWNGLTKKWDALKEQAYANRSELTMVQPILKSPFDPPVRVLHQRASHILTTAMIDAMAYRSKKGVWPPSEKELSHLYTDPFTQTRIQAKVLMGIFRVYRLGLNGKDDGGYSDDEARRLSKTSDDIAFTFQPLGKPTPK